MGRRANLYLFFFLTLLKAYSQQDAASAALGEATVAYGSEWSAAGNPAGICLTKGFSAGASFANSFFIKELSREIVAVNVPAGRSFVSAIFSYYGFSLYNEMTISAAYSMKLARHLAAGVRIDYERLSVGEGYGSKNLLTFRIGLVYRVAENFSAGLLIANPFPVKISEDEYVPAFIRTGIRWDISHSLISLLELEKDLRNPAVIKSGLEYHIVKPVYARAGFLTSPGRFTFGFGIELSRIRIDFSSSWHSLLGYSPQVSILYSSGK